MSHCEYCGAPLPEGTDKRTRRQRTAHFAVHAAERTDKVSFTAERNVTDAERWRKLMDLCGAWQDGSDQMVRLHQDDAARVVIIDFGEQSTFGPTFESALDHIPD